MSATRIKLPFVRTYADRDAETAMGMLQVAYLKQDAPMAPRGTRVGVHIYCYGGEGMGIVGIVTLVLEAMDGVAWESRAQVNTMVVSLGACDEGETPFTDIWINREDEDE